MRSPERTGKERCSGSAAPSTNGKRRAAHHAGGPLATSSRSALSVAVTTMTGGRRGQDGRRCRRSRRPRRRRAGARLERAARVRMVVARVTVAVGRRRRRRRARGAGARLERAARVGVVVARVTVAVGGRGRRPRGRRRMRPRTQACGRGQGDQGDERHGETDAAGAGGRAGHGFSLPGRHTVCSSRRDDPQSSPSERCRSRCSYSHRRRHAYSNRP
jgi:hypothetical protein